MSVMAATADPTLRLKILRNREVSQAVNGASGGAGKGEVIADGPHDRDAHTRGMGCEELAAEIVGAMAGLRAQGPRRVYGGTSRGLKAGHGAKRGQPVPALSLRMDSLRGPYSRLSSCELN